MNPEIFNKRNLNTYFDRYDDAKRVKESEVRKVAKLVAEDVKKILSAKSADLSDSKKKGLS